VKALSAIWLLSRDVEILSTNLALVKKGKKKIAQGN
jgi:hypothetical protein